MARALEADRKGTATQRILPFKKGVEKKATYIPNVKPHRLQQL